MPKKRKETANAARAYITDEQWVRFARVVTRDHPTAGYKRHHTAFYEQLISQETGEFRKEAKFTVKALRDAACDILSLDTEGSLISFNSRTVADRLAWFRKLADDIVPMVNSQAESISLAAPLSAELNFFKFLELNRGDISVDLMVDIGRLLGFRQRPKAESWHIAGKAYLLKRICEQMFLDMGRADTGCADDHDDSAEDSQCSSDGDDDDGDGDDGDYTEKDAQQDSDDDSERRSNRSIENSDRAAADDQSASSEVLHQDRGPAIRVGRAAHHKSGAAANRGHTSQTSAPVTPAVQVLLTKYTPNSSDAGILKLLTHRIWYEKYKNGAVWSEPLMTNEWLREALDEFALRTRKQYSLTDCFEGIASTAKGWIDKVNSNARDDADLPTQSWQSVLDGGGHQCELRKAWMQYWCKTILHGKVAVIRARTKRKEGDPRSGTSRSVQQRQKMQRVAMHADGVNTLRTERSTTTTVSVNAQGSNAGGCTSAQVEDDGSSAVFNGFEQSWDDYGGEVSDGEPSMGRARSLSQVASGSGDAERGSERGRGRGLGRGRGRGREVSSALPTQPPTTSANLSSAMSIDAALTKYQNDGKQLAEELRAGECARHAQTMQKLDESTSILRDLVPVMKDILLELRNRPQQQVPPYPYFGGDSYGSPTPTPMTTALVSAPPRPQMYAHGGSGSSSGGGVASGVGSGSGGRGAAFGGYGAAGPFTMYGGGR